MSDDLGTSEIHRILKAWQLPKDEKRAGPADWDALAKAFKDEIASPLSRCTALANMAIGRAKWLGGTAPDFNASISDCVSLFYETAPGWLLSIYTGRTWTRVAAYAEPHSENYEAEAAQGGAHALCRALVITYCQVRSAGCRIANLDGRGE